MILFEHFNINRILDKDEIGDPYNVIASHLSREFMMKISPEDIKAIEIDGTQIIDVIFKSDFKFEKTRMEFPIKIHSGSNISDTIENSIIKINMK